MWFPFTRRHERRPGSGAPPDFLLRDLVLRQPARELVASKWKHMRVNGSKFAFFYFHLFFRIHNFQRITSEKNKKKSSPLSARAQVVVRPGCQTAPASPRPATGVDSANWNSMAIISDFVKRKSLSPGWSGASRRHRSFRPAGSRTDRGQPAVRLPAGPTFDSTLRRSAWLRSGVRQVRPSGLGRRCRSGSSPHRRSGGPSMAKRSRTRPTVKSTISSSVCGLA